MWSGVRASGLGQARLDRLAGLGLLEGVWRRRRGCWRRRGSSTGCGVAGFWRRKLGSRGGAQAGDKAPMCELSVCFGWIGGQVVGARKQPRVIIYERGDRARR